MKKHLIAAAVAAAVAVPAAAQVTISGILDTGYAQSKFRDAAGDEVKFKRTGNASGMSTSTLNFSGTEDLGGGLKASFFVNSSINSSSGAYGARDTWAAISGGFGEVKIGRFTPAAETTTSVYAVTGTVNLPGSIDYMFGGSTYGGTPTTGTASTISTFNGSGIATGLAELGRQGNNMQFTSPAFAGVTLAIGHVKSTLDASAQVSLNAQGGTSTIAVGEAELTQTDVTLNYKQGKFSLGLAFAEQDRVGADATIAAAGTAKNETEFNSVGVSYDLGMALVKAAIINRKDKVAGVQDQKAEASVIGITLPMGSTSLFANLVDGELKGDGTAAEAADHRGYQVGAVYNLSKRTNIYAVYGDDEFKYAAGKVTADGVAIGVRHSF